MSRHTDRPYHSRNGKLAAGAVVRCGVQAPGSPSFPPEEAEALAEAAGVGVRAAARRGAFLRPVTSEHAVTLLRKAIGEASRGRTAPVTLSWTRPEAAALAARAREGVGLGDEFGLIDAPELASRALAALDAFIDDTELIPAPGAAAASTEQQQAVA